MTHCLPWQMEKLSLKEKIKQAELLVVQKNEARKKMVKTIEYDVKEAYFNYQYQQDKLHSSELKLNSSKVSLEAMEAKLRNGLATVKDVLDAQVVYHQAEADFEQTKSDYYLAKVTLFKVTGTLTQAVL